MKSTRHTPREASHELHSSLIDEGDHPRLFPVVRPGALGMYNLMASRAGGTHTAHVSFALLGSGCDVHLAGDPTSCTIIIEHLRALGFTED